jgi:hypothetical protein
MFAVCVPRPVSGFDLEKGLIFLPAITSNCGSKLNEAA